MKSLRQNPTDEKLKQMVEEVDTNSRYTVMKSLRQNICPFTFYVTDVLVLLDSDEIITTEPNSRGIKTDGRGGRHK